MTCKRSDPLILCRGSNSKNVDSLPLLCHLLILDYLNRRSALSSSLFYCEHIFKKIIISCFSICESLTSCKDLAFLPRFLQIFTHTLSFLPSFGRCFLSPSFEYASRKNKPHLRSLETVVSLVPFPFPYTVFFFLTQNFIFQSLPFLYKCFSFYILQS